MNDLPTSIIRHIADYVMENPYRRVTLEALGRDDVSALATIVRLTLDSELDAAFSSSNPRAHQYLERRSTLSFR
jgi:hypothetical protein